MQEAQTGSRAGHEGPRGELAVELHAPAPRHRRGARRAAAIRRDAVVTDLIAETRDQGLLARRAVGVFEPTDGSWQVARVYVAQTCRPSDVGRRDEHVGR